MKNENRTYLILTVILLILSAIGIFFFFQIKPNQKTSPVTSSITPKIELIPTDSPDLQETITPIPTIATSSTQKITPTISPICTPPPCPTGSKPSCPSGKQCPGGCGVTCSKPTITTTPTPIASSSSAATLTYSSTADGFSVDYTSKRKLYPDTESSGNRYTFYYSTGNFAVHVGLNDKWAWTNPDRQFTSAFMISGQNTFRYDISTQTIVDLQFNNKNYTLQCVHNGKESLKTECEDFLQSFKLL